MKATKLFLILIFLFMGGNIADVNAQSWLERLGKRAEEAAKRKVERKVEHKVEEKVDDAVNNVFDKAEESAKQKPKKKSTSNTSIVEPPDTGTPVDDTSDWDNNEPYYALKKGTVITYTMYDGKGKIQGYNQSEILDITRTRNSVNAVVSGRITDVKGKVQNGGIVSISAQNGNFHVNMLNIISPKGLEGVDFDAKMTGNDMMIPIKLAPGQSLPDAYASFKMKMKAGTDVLEMPSLEFRVFNRRAVRAESVDTPLGKFICFKIIQTVAVDYPLIGTRQGTSITWIGKGLGVIKSEFYDAKGKLASRMLLTGLE